MINYRLNFMGLFIVNDNKLECVDKFYGLIYFKKMKKFINLKNNLFVFNID